MEKTERRKEKKQEEKGGEKAREGRGRQVIEKICSQEVQLQRITSSTELYFDAEIIRIF